MTIVDLLDRNARLYPEEEALVEINPENHPSRTRSWREYNLIETAAPSPGVNLSSRPTGPQICCSHVASSEETRWRFC